MIEIFATDARDQYALRASQFTNKGMGGLHLYQPCANIPEGDMLALS